MEGTPLIESSRGEDEDDNKKEKKSKSKSDFYPMPHSVLEKLMNDTRLDREADKAKKVEKSKEKVESSEDEDDAPKTVATESPISIRENSEAAQSESVTEILGSVEDELNQTAETNNLDPAIDMSEFEAEFSEPQEVEPSDEDDIEDTESLGQIIQRNFGKNASTSNTPNTAANNPPVSPVSPPTPPLGPPPPPQGPPPPPQPGQNPNAGPPPINPNGPPPGIPNMPPPPPGVPNQPPQVFNPNNLPNPQVNPQIINHNTIVNPVEHYHTAPTAALLAVDYLSHRSNKRRTEKVKKQLGSELDELRDQQNANYLSSESQRSQLESKVKELEGKQNVSLNTFSSAEIYNSTNKTEAQVEALNQTNDFELSDNISVNENNISARPEQANERFMQQVQEAVEAKDGIKSEFAFERRHEVRDVPTQRPVIAPQEAIDTSYPAMTDKSQSYTNQTIKPDSVPNSRRTIEVKEPMNEVVTTGIWGAVVGIIVFIVIYILTRR